MEANWRQQLLELSGRLNLEELKNICFVLKAQVPDLDFENLKGDTKEGKYRELIDFVEHRQKIPELLDVMVKLRPDLEPLVSDIRPEIPIPGGNSRPRGIKSRIVIWWGSLSNKARIAYLSVLVVLLVLFCGLTGTLIGPVITEWAKTQQFRPTAVVVANATMAPPVSPTLTSVVPSDTPTLAPLVTPTAMNTPSSPALWPAVNTFAYPDPDGLCSITAANAADPERPNMIKITFDTQAERSWCIWEARLVPDYDASQKTTLSFWVKGEKGGEQFRVGIKDSATLPGQEPKLTQTASAEWQNVRVPLSDFQNLKPQNLSVLKNFSLSFTHDLGSGAIYVDGFVFEP